MYGLPNFIYPLRLCGVGVKLHEISMSYPRTARSLTKLYK